MKQTKERSIRIFLASLKSEKVKHDYIKSLERFQKFLKIDDLDEYVTKEPMSVQRDLVQISFSY